MFRAAYDTLDGTGISYKFRLKGALEDISSKAISAVYPEYYMSVLPTLNKIDDIIAEHKKTQRRARSIKDSGFRKLLYHNRITLRSCRRNNRQNS